MQRILFFFLILGLLLVNISFGQSNFVFGVKPGSTINSAYLGLKINMLVPFFGVDMFGISASGKYSDTDYNYYYSNWSNTTYEWRSIETTEFSGSAFLLIPHFGAKLYLGTQNVRPYFFGNVFFSKPSVNAEAKWKEEWWEYENGHLVDHDIDSDSEELEDKTKETIEDVLNFWGITFGGGAEYFFSEHFSIGGEYGIRLLFNKIEYSEENQDSYRPDDSYSEKWEGEASACFKVSYAVFTLNYYF